MFGVINVTSEVKKLKSFERGVRHTFRKIHDALDDHLHTINTTTEEVQNIYDILSELDAKIDKINERIDKVEMIVSPEVNYQYNISLTNREQEVFTVLYSEETTTLNDMAKKLGFNQEMVNKYIHNLIAKGIPVLRTFDDGVVSFSLDLKFKDLQARKNILNINENISREILTEKTI